MAHVRNWRCGPIRKAALIILIPLTLAALAVLGAVEGFAQGYIELERPFRRAWRGPFN